eukprot:CAMPEP_0183828968 /NCGR_PEP_ID=MMETSP0807_2-20130328/3068_1 /TAXON_ID=88271 /ORGANISM="Picocystis salinarum, Strain CCMP1897" /LENGTH=791 /DNA_ID=CAMNT_0026074175 /DNA_START=87 /DNA_END=2462 /DNA_ORIENTATION=-
MAPPCAPKDLPSAPEVEDDGRKTKENGGERCLLVTSALPYVNNVPHLGNLIGCVLSADAYARFARARGHRVLFVCGTDEYGTATEAKAIEENCTPREICDRYHAIHANVYEWFDVAFDIFGRTSTPTQTEICQSMFWKIHERGFITEDTVEQLYSDALGRFLADRFVEGTCPHCGYQDARGDQCDGCGALLNPIELINPRCKITGTTPRIRSTDHLFLDLPRLKPELEEYIESTSDHGNWSDNCLAVTRAWLRDGLKTRCITRDLKWGTQVPLEGYKDKVFYVWFDAPIGYISITAGQCGDWEKWWKNPGNVELVQFMGKDNVPFHTVIFPSTLIGSGDNWTMMKKISVTEYLNYEGGKFSKSRGTGVFGDDAMKTGIPSEVWRYYLLSNRPEQSDSMFMWTDLQAKNNNELLANLGNFVNRTLKFISARFDGRIPKPTSAGGASAAALGGDASEIVGSYIAQMERLKLKDGLRLAMALSKLGNGYFQEQQPWVSLKEDLSCCATCIAACAGLVKVLAALLQPFIPSVTAKILKQLNLPEEDYGLGNEIIDLVRTPQNLLEADHPIGQPETLFRTITDEEVAGFRERFSGDQKTDLANAAASADSSKPAVRKKAKGGKGAPPAQEKPVDLSRLDVRVGLITKCWKHPEADTLYCEEIDVGEAVPRQVVSGLVKHIPLDEMQERPCVVLCNLKPSNVRGIRSHAMVLCASEDGKAKVETLFPPSGSRPGDRITCDGFSPDPDEVLNPKKKVWEQVQADMTVNGEGVACYAGKPLGTSAGVVTVATVRNAPIS